MKCPNCGHEQADELAECARCQVIFAKLEAKKRRAEAGAEAADNMPSSVTMGLIAKSILALRARAVRHTFAEDGNEGAVLDQEVMNGLTVRVSDAIRFIYTIEHFRGGLLHAVSSQLVCDKPREYQVQCMLIVMLTFNRELERAGISVDDVELDIEESDPGTQYLRILLSPEQHKRLLSGGIGDADY